MFQYQHSLSILILVTYMYYSLTSWSPSFGWKSEIYYFHKQQHVHQRWQPCKFTFLSLCWHPVYDSCIKPSHLMKLDGCYSINMKTVMGNLEKMVWQLGALWKQDFMSCISVGLSPLYMYHTLHMQLAAWHCTAIESIIWANP